jgi:hypothetical protein
MLNTLEDIRIAIQDDLTIGDESSLFTPTIIDRAINRAYTKCATLYRWPQLEDAKKTSTQASLEYYEYPSTWRPDSIWRLEVDDEQYGEDPDGSPLNYEDYLTWRRDDDNANSTDKKWANQKTRYFIYPVPTTNGTWNISVWGIKNHTKLTGNSDITVFSYNMPELNEAVELEALAILRSKGEDEKTGQFKSVEAKTILTVAFNKIKAEQHKYDKNQPMFEVEDMFGSSKGEIGNF